MGNGNGLRAGLVGAAGAAAPAEFREVPAAPPLPPNPLEGVELDRSPKLGRPPKLLFDGRVAADGVDEFAPVAGEPNAADETDGDEAEVDLEDAPPNGLRDVVPSEGRASAVERAAVDGRVTLLFPPPHAGRLAGASFSFDASVSLVEDCDVLFEAAAVRLFVGWPKASAVRSPDRSFRLGPLPRLVLDVALDAVRWTRLAAVEFSPCEC